MMENAGGSLVPHTVVNRIAAYMRECQVQPGNNAAIARDAEARIAAGHHAVASMINAEPSEIIIGPSTTRNAMTLALSLRQSFQIGDEVVVTNLDHEANNNYWRKLSESGITVREWRANPETAALETAELERILNERTRLVCFTHCSNLTGQINPVREISRLVHDAGALVCVDGVAYAPHNCVDVKELDVDFYLFSLYKTFGPHLGVMYGKRERLFDTQGMYFFFHDESDIPVKLNPGAPNHELTAGCAGIDDYIAALEAHHFDDPANDAHTRYRRVYDLFARHERKISSRFLNFAGERDRLRILGPDDANDQKRAPTFSFTIEGIANGDVLEHLESRGIVANAGDFYAPRILRSLGIDAREGVMRASLLHYNTLSETDRLIAALDEIMRP